MCINAFDSSFLTWSLAVAVYFFPLQVQKHCFIYSRTAFFSLQPLRQPKAANSELNDTFLIPSTHSASLPTKAAAFTQNSRDALPSRAKTENSNISALEYNYQEHPIESAIREGWEISSIPFY